MNSEEKPNLEQMNCLEIKKQKEEVCGSEMLGDLGSLIQERIGRVCVTSGTEAIDGLGSNEVAVGNEHKHETNNLEVVSDGVKSVNENEVKNDTEKGKDDEDGGDLEDSEEDESSSSASSSSDDSSGDDDEEEEDDESYEEGLKEVKGEVEMNEGEIREEVLAWSDDDDGDTVKGPIRSMNEVQDLPPVPPVTVTIQPHHQTLPVGAVLSIMGSQVIVEGVEDHNPLSEGSVLWLTESRSPLGVVDEIFGPVKNPYYVVRYNSETEIPTGIQQGCLISFVPEFADYVLNNNNIYKKGYDASGENDEECSEELEFSDDEKETEYKRMLKMAKRGSGREKNGRIKKDKKSRNHGGNRKDDHQPSAGGPTTGPQAFSQAPNITPSGIWPYGFPSIQPQNIGFPPNGFPSNVPPFMQQNFIQQPFQNLGVPNLASFDPQFNTTPGQMFPGNFVQGVPPNFGAFASWPSGMPQNNFSQSQVGPPMVFPGLPQGVAMPNRLQMENNNGAVSPFVAAANGETCQNPNQGNTFPNRGGRSGPRSQRGGGRFQGGRSGPRSR